MQILELSSGEVSLEMAPDEVSQVLADLAQFGRVTREAGVTHDLLRVGAADFIYLDEWDEPCLISHNASAASILRGIAAAENEPRSLRTGSHG